LKDKIRTTQIKAAMTVNRELLTLYWELGREICEKQEKANWGGRVDRSGGERSFCGFSGCEGVFKREFILYLEMVSLL
jgi:hypothetical protein